MVETQVEAMVEMLPVEDLAEVVEAPEDTVVEELLTENGKPVVIREDNKAAIDMVNDGATTSDRTKHVHIRNSFIGQFIDSNEIDVEYCPTNEMAADIYTKPLQKAQFVYLRDYLLGYRIP